MTGLRALLKKRDYINKTTTGTSAPTTTYATEFTFIRSTTDSAEEIHPPEHPTETISASRSPHKSDDPHQHAYRTSANAEYTHDPTARRFYDSSNASRAEPAYTGDTDRTAPREHRLSKFLNRRSRAKSSSDVTSTSLLQDLGEAPPVPSISVTGDADETAQRKQEAQWEKRATILATNSSTLLHGNGSSQQSIRSSNRSRSRSPSISDQRSDINIQEAIRLHENGDLTASTRMFGRLADPDGDNVALAQVLYGLALRHGWGTEVNSQIAVEYLSLAAANAAGVEEQALAAGVVNDGAAKGELVLAIFELGNCLRNGLGVKKDAVAARHYYETAANLGDTDAMEQAAQCYLDGVGGTKDKFKAAQYLRLAEKKGGKIVGNSWIWKDKYNPK